MSGAIRQRLKKRIWRQLLRKDFGQLLRRHCGTMTEKERMRYSFDVVLKETLYEGYRKKYPEIYWDTPCGIVLCYGGRAVACIGFFVKIKDRPGTIKIIQIQGVKGSADVLAFRWERLLLEIVVEAARHLGYSRVEVLPAEKNEWYRRKLRVSYRLRYNVTPRRMGFRWDAEREVYALQF